MNFSLPEATTFDRRVPKARFYEHLDVSASARRALTGHVKTVWWRNKLAASTLHVAAGKSVTEIEVFEIELQAETLDESVLRLLDAQIPYHILFVLTREGRAQALIGYKEAAGGERRGAQALLLRWRLRLEEDALGEVGHGRDRRPLGTSAGRVAGA